MSDSTTLNPQIITSLEHVTVASDPKRLGGRLYKNVCLFQKSSDCMGFKATSINAFIGGTFAVAGMLGLAVAYTYHVGGGVLLFGLLLSLILGAKVAQLQERRIYFDKKRGHVWGGGRKRDPSTTRFGRHFHAPLAAVVALQLVRERTLIENSKGQIPKICYELNLVYADGARNNLVDHPDLYSLSEETKALAVFLDVPILTTFDLQTELKR